MVGSVMSNETSRRVVRVAGRLARRLIRYPLSPLYKFTLAQLLGLGRYINDPQYPAVSRWPPPTVARAYINQFLTEQAELVRGRCVEFAPPVYQPRFDSKPEVTRYDCWNIDESNGATIVGDLQAAPHVPDESFDTILCTHVLCNVSRPWLAVDEMHRMLSPGGVVLCTVPSVLQRYAPDPADYWRFTKDALTLLFERFSSVEVYSYGNSATVAASPQYLMAYHFLPSVLRHNDPACPSIVACVARK